MDKRKSLLVIAGAVLMTGAALQSKALAAVGTGCYTSGTRCHDGVFGGNCVGTLYNTGNNPYCACALGDQSTFGTWQCSPYGAQ